MSQEAMKLALNKAFQLGQRYWSWADSEYSSHWKKADAAKVEFEQLVQDTINAALAEQKSGIKQVIELYDSPDQSSPATPLREQEPVEFPARKAVEREIERTANPTGMHLNDSKERVALPGGTLRQMLALIDRTSPPTLSLAQRKPLPCETLIELWCDASLANSGSGWFVVSGAFARAIEAAHGIGEKK